MNSSNKISKSQVKSILNAIYSITGESQVLTKIDDEVVFVNPYNVETVENCPFSVPAHLADDYKEPKAKRRIKPTEKYRDLAKAARKGMITNEIVKKTAKKWVENGTVLSVIVDGKKRFFEGRAKSSARYNKANYWKIHDHAKHYKERGMVPYFLTVTNDPSKYNKNYLEAWRGFAKHLSNMLKNICRNFSMAYECVLEAQKSGNPHAHIVLWCSEYFSDDKTVRTKHKSFIVSGEFKDYIRKYEKKMGFMELRRGNDKDPVNYLLKYISKATTRDFYAMAKDLNSLGDSERKDLLSALMPVVSSVRQFNLSRLEKEEEEIKSEFFTEYQSQQEKRIEDFGEGAALDYLKKLCINSPLPCLSKIRFCSYKDVANELNIDIKKLGSLSEERKEELYQNSRCIGCKGCIISHFIKFITEGKDEWFTPKEYSSLSSQKVVQQTNSEVLADTLEDPEEFVNFEENPFSDYEHYKESGFEEMADFDLKKTINKSLQESMDIRAFSIMTREKQFSVNNTYIFTNERKIVVKKPTDEEKKEENLGKVSEFNRVRISKKIDSLIKPRHKDFS